MEILVRTEGGLRAQATDGVTTSIMDEPAANGGTGTALGPSQTLLAALGGCTAMTLKLYAARKGWPLEDVRVRVSLAAPERTAPDQTKRLTQRVELLGPLDGEQRQRLHEIAGRCPVHRLLEGPLAFEELLVDEA